MATTDDTSDAAFAFGRNWEQFLSTVDETRVAAAEQSLCELLNVEHLRGRRFLDAGSGSGLFSLAAHRLGAAVTSFDVDADSFACTQAIKQRFSPDAKNWNVMYGSLTDAAFVRALGRFDVVYCWGVAHHTGKMWLAIDHLMQMVEPGGSIVLAIYNDQLYISRLWSGVKSSYQRLPPWLRPLFVAAVGLVLFAKRLAVTLLASALRLVTLRNPLMPIVNWVGESRTRGMQGWYDLVDWVGGWPFEVAKPEQVFRFLRDRGFILRELTTSIGHGCNEFVFVRSVESDSET